MRTRNARLPLVVLVSGALVLTACGSGDSTVEGAAEPTVPSAGTTTTSAFAEERPEEPTGPVAPPSPTAPENEQNAGDDSGEPPANEPEPAPEEEAAPEPEPEPIPGTGDFEQLVVSMGIEFPEPHVPSVVAGDSCTRFSEGQSMGEVSGWLGEFSGFDENTQGRFLGAAIATFCPENIDNLR